MKPNDEDHKTKVLNRKKKNQNGNISNERNFMGLNYDEKEKTPNLK